jgi:outer membrane protein assembly factor BamB
VYFGKKVYVLDSLSGNFVLAAKTGESLGSFAGTVPPAFYTASNGKDYMLTLSGKLFSSRISTGDVAWSFTGDGSIDVPPIVVNGLVIAGSGAGNLYVLDGLTGTQLWTRKLSAGVQTSMAAGQGTVVVPNGNAITAFVAQ